MPIFELEETVRRHPSGQEPEPEVEENIPTLQVVLKETTDPREWLEGLKGELDTYYKMGREWADSEPDLVLAEISSIVARLTEVRAHLLRDKGQRANRLRLDEVDPLLEKLELQFKITSRRQTLREFDWKVAGGQSS